MTAWTNDELKNIGTAEELQIAPLLQDGTLRNRVTNWVVRVWKDLYVHCYREQRGSWYRAALQRHKGHICAGGIEKDVNFVEVSDPAINAQIDKAYSTKYNAFSQ